MICLIPKDDCCLIELSNWRPLTLLNVDYKILAKLLVKELSQPYLRSYILIKQALLKVDSLAKMFGF